MVPDSGSRLASNDTHLYGVLPKTERPKSLDLSGQGFTRLTVPLLNSPKQHAPASDRLDGVEEEDVESVKQKALDRSVSCTAVRRTGSEVQLDPLSQMAAEPECDQNSSSSTPSSSRNLVEEIETYMNNSSSPLRSCTPCTDLQNSSSPLFRSPSSGHSPQSSTLVRSSTHLSLPVRSKERLRPSPSLPLGVCRKDRERPSSLVSPSSPSPSNSSFSMDSLFTPTLDIFKSSVISAGKGVAEKASRLYSRLSSQTSLTQVRCVRFSKHFAQQLSLRTSAVFQRLSHVSSVGCKLRPSKCFLADLSGGRMLLVDRELRIQSGPRRLYFPSAQQRVSAENKPCWGLPPEPGQPQ